ncbi:MAG: pacearchaeosortase [Nanoarchaeota archaeon]
MKIKKRDNKKIKQKKIVLISLRYLFLLAIVFALPILYTLLTVPTVFPVLILLKLMYTQVEFIEPIIIIDAVTFIEIVPACIAGSAYLLLIILNFSIPLHLRKRMHVLFFSLAMFFILNVTRIILLSIWYHEKFSFFNSVHLVLWYVLSTILVIAIWLFTIKIFSIKEIPFYTDLMQLIKLRK